jgi:hypothetical protein
MVADEHSAKFADGTGMALLDCKSARFHVERIGGIEDRDDGKIIELGRG